MNGIGLNGWFFFRSWGSAIYLYLYNLFACVLVPFRKNVVGDFVLYTKTLYRFAMRQRLGLILEIKSLYNKGCISTKEASFIVFDLHFISKSSLLYITIMISNSAAKVQILLFSPKLSAYLWVLTVNAKLANFFYFVACGSIELQLSLTCAHAMK